MKVKKYEMFMNVNQIPYLSELSETCYSEGTFVNSPEVIANIIKMEYNSYKLPEEHLWMLSMNVLGELIAIFEISIGTPFMTYFSNAQILQRALLSGAIRIAIVHNHPSGQALPSKADIDATKKLSKACKLCGIKLIDHVIVTGANRNEYYSFQATNPKMFK